MTKASREQAEITSKKCTAPNTEPNTALSDTLDNAQKTEQEALIFPVAKNGYNYLIDAIILIVLSIIICAANLQVPKHSIIPPVSNDAMHLDFANTLMCAIEHAPSWWEALIAVWVWPCFYPAGSYFVTYLYCQVFGTDIVSVLSSLVVFIPILLAAVYYIIRPRSGVLAALAAVLAASSVPYGLLCTMRYPSDFQVGVGAIVTLCALFYSDELRNRKRTLLFGIIFGYSLLFKSNVAWFVAPALAVILISRWRDWWRAPWSALWHLSLLVSAFLICTIPVSKCEPIQQDMARSGSFISPSVLKMLALVIIVCTLWWWLAQAQWWKVKRIHILTNLSHALVLTFLVAMPWILTNFPLVGSQRGILSRQLIAYFQPASLANAALSIYYNSFGPIFVSLLLLSWIFACTKWANVQERALTASAFFGFVATTGFLGYAPRYYFPCFIVSACCLAAPLRRSKILVGIAILAGIWGGYSSIIIPAYPSFNDSLESKGLHLNANTGGHIWRYDMRGNANDSLYAHIWQACPALASSQQPRWVGIRMSHCPVTHYEDAFHSISAWSSTHEGLLIPFYLRDNEYTFITNKCMYLPLFSANHTHFPDFAEQIHAFFASKDIIEATATMRRILHTCAHFLDFSRSDSAPFTTDEVAVIMNCPHPTYQTIELQDCVIHIWSRPGMSPRREDLQIPANALIPAPE